MKKSIRTAAAIMAAVMAMFCAAVPAFAEEAETISAVEDLPLAGGWQIIDGSLSMSKNPEAKAAFKKATGKLEGASYKAIAVLASQVVAGMNYAVLCRETPADGSEAHIKIAYIYADLQGDAEVIGFQTLIGDQLMGGYTANTGKYGISQNKDLYKAYKAATKELVGVSYEPVAYLGSAVVAGTRYLVLCRGKVAAPNAKNNYYLVSVCVDLEGKASLDEINVLAFGSYDDDGVQTEDAAQEEDSGMDGMANPWSEYSKVSEAAKAAGVSIKAPKKLGSHKLTTILAMKGLVDLRYTKDGNEICVRKGLGTDDVSGDYNEYKSVTTKEILGVPVEIRSNGKGISGIIWTDGTYAYSIRSEKPLTEKFLISIVTKLLA
jgi:hypothetical protein